MLIERCTSIILLRSVGRRPRAIIYIIQEHVCKAVALSMQSTSVKLSHVAPRRAVWRCSESSSVLSCVEMLEIMFNLQLIMSFRSVSVYISYLSLCPCALCVCLYHIAVSCQSMYMQYHAASCQSIRSVRVCVSAHRILLLCMCSQGDESFFPIYEVNHLVLSCCFA